MGSLKEFLAEQGERLKTLESEAARKRDEWIASVDRLNQQIRAWIREADQGHILEIRDRQYQIREEGIGSYEIRGLSIGLGPHEIRVQPVARNVAGPLSATGVVQVIRAYGRVDLTDGLRRYMIFRTEKDPEDRWIIIEQDDFRMRPFDQNSFEAAFRDLLE